MTHFEADFKDNTTYIQGADDVSIDTEGRNAFYDILQRMDDVVQFHLIKDDNTRYTVDLRDGHFEINGIAFTSHDQFYVPGVLKLIYFKEMHQNFHAGDSEPYEIKVNRYFIGWECNKNGKTTKATIAIE